MKLARLRLRNEFCFLFFVEVEEGMVEVFFNKFTHIHSVKLIFISLILIQSRATTILIVIGNLAMG